MTTRKTATVAAAAATLAVVLAYSALILPVSAQAANISAATSTSSTIQNVPPGLHGGAFGGVMQAHKGGPMWGGANVRGQGRQQANLTVGQTITLTSTQGKFYVVGNAKDNGTASGTVTFTVTGKLAAGFALSITQGSLVVNGTTYAISSGSAQMDRSASALVGQGATTPSGQFLVRASAHGSFVGSTATMSLDLSSGTTEYLVFLSGTA